MAKTSRLSEERDGSIPATFKTILGFFAQAREKRRLYPGLAGSGEQEAADRLWDYGQQALLAHVHSLLNFATLVDLFGGLTPVATDVVERWHGDTNLRTREDYAHQLHSLLLDACLRLRADAKAGRAARPAALSDLNRAYCGLLELLS